MEIGRTVRGNGTWHDTTARHAEPTLELVCADCGYGVIVRRPPPMCPMCGAEAWEPPVWRPFSRLREPPDAAA